MGRSLSNAVSTVIETLEQRRLLSAGADAGGSFHHGVLSLHGTNKADFITVAVSDSDSTKYEVHLNDYSRLISISEVKAIAIDGRAGNDDIEIGDTVTIPTYLIGGKGNDTLNGGSGNDGIMGGPGADLIYGNAGNDMIVGGTGDDLINAGDGNDVVMAENGADQVSGGAGNDMIFGGAGNDQLFGEEGNDTLVGGAGKDSLDGGDGQDNLNGGQGMDHIVGVMGEDKFNKMDRKSECHAANVVNDTGNHEKPKDDTSGHHEEHHEPTHV